MHVLAEIKDKPPCVSNPCLNDGVCRNVNSYEYKCDCSGTHYTGQNCHIGVIDIPQVPVLKVNQTVIITAEAHPASLLHLHMSTTCLTCMFISPSHLVFNSLSTKAIFVIKGLTKGIHFIGFNLSGNDAKSFEKPQSMMVVVQSANHTHFSHFDDHNHSVGVLTPGCCEKEIQSNLFCTKTDSSFKLLSSCSWINEETFGIVFANTSDQHYVPISIVGGHLQNVHPFFELPSSQYSCTSCSPQCSHPNITEDDVFDLIMSSSLANTFLAYVSDLLPWVSLEIGEFFYYNDNFHSFETIVDIVEGKDISLISGCENLNLLDTEIYAVLRYNRTFDVTLNGIRHTYNPRYLDSPVCFAVSLCNNQSPVHVSIPIGHQDDLLGLITILKVKKYLQPSINFTCILFYQLEFQR